MGTKFVLYRIYRKYRNIGHSEHPALTIGLLCHDPGGFPEACSGSLKQNI